MAEFIKAAAELQEKYQTLVRTKRLSKKAICELCVPFRDKYKLTDLQTLRIARKEFDLSQLILIYERSIA